VCLAFYLSRPLYHRNYGGMTSGFRWMFWLTPLWVVAMLPAVDCISKSRWGSGVAIVLLVFSIVSTVYPVWDPWSQPWIYDFMKYVQGIGN
jgi:hypothetical protein